VILLLEEKQEWWDNQLLLLQEKMGYYFSDRSKLEEALTHSSYSNEAGLPYSNERLEFLGDAVLEITVSSYLYKEFPEKNEGELTRLRAALVRNDSLNEWSGFLELPDILLLGKGLSRQRNTGEKNIHESFISDALEALFGAVYLDGGFNESSRVIQKYIDFAKKSITGTSTSDPKSRLQIETQKLGLGHPSYVLESVSGPAHEPVFTVRVFIDEKPFSCGEGTSRKEAEFRAAAESMQEIMNDTEVGK